MAKALNVNPTGDKRLKKTWIAAIAEFYSSQQTEKKAAPTPAQPTQSVTALEAIKELTEKYDNYIPIYEYRTALSYLNRKQQDDALYALQRQDAIELSTLVDPTPYSSEQIKQGIQQMIGGPIFFVMLAA